MTVTVFAKKTRAIINGEGDKNRTRSDQPLNRTPVLLFLLEKNQIFEFPAEALNAPHHLQENANCFFIRFMDCKVPHLRE